MAVGTLAVGMIFIGGTFLVGIYFSTIATERTIAAVAADEAFAKIKIFRVNLNDPNFTVTNQQARFKGVVWNKNNFDPNEFAYPSIKILAESRYCWSALCRRIDLNPSDRRVQVTVFVCRRVGVSARYRNPTDPFEPVIALYRPVPLQVEVSANPGLPEVLTINVFDERVFINDGYTIVENSTGDIYRVLKRNADQPDTVLLDKPWDPD
ncbi:unnamed protein product, partial [marine sediment metagenome]